MSYVSLCFWRILPVCWPYVGPADDSRIIWERFGHDSTDRNCHLAPASLQSLLKFPPGRCTLFGEIWEDAFRLSRKFSANVALATKSDAPTSIAPATANIIPTSPIISPAMISRSAVVVMRCGGMWWCGGVVWWCGVRWWGGEARLWDVVWCGKVWWDVVRCGEMWCDVM